MKCSARNLGNDWEAIERQQSEAAERMERAQQMAAKLRDAVAGAR